VTALPPGWTAALGEHAPPRLRHPLDASCWRLDLEGASVLFDTGAGVGPAPAPPDLVVLTHGHMDHAGGAARLAAAGSRVMAGALTAQWLAEGNEAAVSLDRARRAGLYPASARLSPCPGIEVVADGTTLAFGRAALEAIATPGHSNDHVSWLVTLDGRRTLVGGDALFVGGTVILQDSWDCSVERTCASIRRLAALAPDDILPGHGPPLIGAAAAEAIRAAMARVARLLPPALFM
jgi:hydroxyacylglutathione hydrolase